MSTIGMRARRWPTALLLAGLAFGGAGALSAPAALAQTGGAGTSSPEELRYRLDILAAELADIRTRLGRVPGAPVVGVAPAGVLSNSGVVELEGELRRLTAAVEELQHQVRRIGEEAARRFSDIEFRLTELEGGDISTLQPVPPLGGSAATPAPAVSGQPSQAGTPSLTPTPLPGASSTGGQASNTRQPARGIVSGPSGQGNFGGVEVPLLSGQSVGQGVASVSVAEQGDLERAVQDVRQGRFDQAEERLRRFLNEYPASPLTANAWYWLGESQFIRGNHAEAARSFLNGYNTDQSGPRAPHNLYRLGVTLGRLGQTSEACLTLREVRTQYPDAPDGIVEQSDAEADALACG